MTKRGRLLSVLAVVAAVIVVVFFMFKPGPDRPLKPDAQIRFTRPTGTCVKTSSEIEGFLRGSAGQQTRFTWLITNGCDPSATVCVTDFTHETEGMVSPFPENRYCNEPNGPNANRITADVRSDAPTGIYYYSVYLGATKMDPMIDIVP
jgi:hypothetical protein